MENEIPEITKNQMGYMVSKKRRELVSTKGITVDIQPYMFPPKSPFSYSTRVLLDSMKIKEDSVLEIGTGCGILSIFAAKQGAKVDGVDILPECIQFSLDNAVRNDVFQNTRFYYSDMFSNIDRKYDSIICNLPILNQSLPEEDSRWYSLFDPNFEFHKELFSKGKKFAPKITLAHANLLGKNDFENLEKLAESFGWGVLEFSEKNYSEHKWRCYEFGRKK